MMGVTPAFRPIEGDHHLKPKREGEMQRVLAGFLGFIPKKMKSEKTTKISVSRSEIRLWDGWGSCSWSDWDGLQAGAMPLGT